MHERKNFNAANDHVSLLTAYNHVGWQSLTEFQMLLRATQQLCYPRWKTLGEDEYFTSEKVITNQEHQDLNEVMEKRHFLEGKSSDYTTLLAFRSGFYARESTYETVVSPGLSTA